MGSFLVYFKAFFIKLLDTFKNKKWAENKKLNKKW